MLLTAAGPISTISAQETMPQGFKMAPGDVCPSFLLCYDREGLAKLAEYQEICGTYRQEAQACEARAESIIDSEPWYSSPWFYLAIGLAVGSGTVAVLK